MILTAVHRSVGDIPNGSRFHDVADDELLDRLILRHATSAVGAADGFHMAAVVLAASSITPLLSLRAVASSGGSHGNNASKQVKPPD